MAETYRLKIQGLKDGYATDDVAASLAPLFRRNKADVLPLLEASGTVVKKGIDMATATKYQGSLERRGCVCVIEPEPPRPPRQATVTPIVRPRPGPPTKAGHPKIAPVRRIPWMVLAAMAGCITLAVVAMRFL